MRVLRGMVVIAVIGFGCSVRPADAVDTVLGSDATDKVNVAINEKSANPLEHKIQYLAKDTAIVLGSVDDPITNGAAAVVFSATDCQCIVMGQAPGTTPGWTLNGSGTTYRWKDAVTKSSAQVKNGKIKFKRKGGITYGLDATPQGEVEVQVTFGTSADRFCTRFAAPPNPRDDTATSYKSKVFDTGTASCSAVPGFCGACAPPIPTTTTTTTSTTTTFPTACCSRDTASAPPSVCFDAAAADGAAKCALLDGTLGPAGSVCDANTGTCGSIKAAGPLCCECPVSSPPFPHPQYCFDLPADLDLWSDCLGMGCSLISTGSCGPNTETCGGSPSGAFLDPTRNELLIRQG